MNAAETELRHTHLGPRKYTENHVVGASTSPPLVHFQWVRLRTSAPVLQEQVAKHKALWGQPKGKSNEGLKGPVFVTCMWRDAVPFFASRAPKMKLCR